MNNFYQNYLTDKSFTLLTEFKRRYQFVLIGGWGVYFYTNALKSKDIDIIIDYSQLEKIKKDFPLEKNNKLRKYQIKVEEIDIDIYLPYYSKLGMPVEEIIKKTTLVNGFIVLKKEFLLITKLKAYQDRKNSVKGQKDLIDIISLVLLEDFDCQYFLRLIKRYKLESIQKTLLEIIKKTKKIEEIHLNQHLFSKKRKILLEKFS